MAGPLEVQVLSMEDLRPAVERCADEGSVRDREFQTPPPPHSPGVYVWVTSGGLVVYIGEAMDLADRLGREDHLVAGYDPAGEHWQVSVVHMLRVHNARPRWITTRDEDDTKPVERLLIEWHRACVGIAPLAIGWDTKKDSPRARAERWARDLWNEDPDTRPDGHGI